MKMPVNVFLNQGTSKQTNKHYLNNVFFVNEVKYTCFQSIVVADYCKKLILNQCEMVKQNTSPTGGALLLSVHSCYVNNRSISVKVDFHERI